MSERRKPYQKHLGETELPQELYYFNEGVYIYSERSKRGMLKAPIYAKKLPGLKVRGLQAFRSMETIPMESHLITEGSRYWQLPEGTIFGAYAHSAKKVKK